MPLQAALEMGEHRGVGDRQRGDVHRDRAPAPIAARARAARATSLEDHPVDLPHQPVALGRGQELPGRDERPVGFVGEPQQRLVVGDAPVASATIGWKCSTNSSCVERAAQALEPGAPVQARRRAQPRGHSARRDADRAGRGAAGRCSARAGAWALSSSASRRWFDGAAHHLRRGGHLPQRRGRCVSAAEAHTGGARGRRPRAAARRARSSSRPRSHRRPRTAASRR